MRSRGEQNSVNLLRRGGIAPPRSANRYGQAESLLDKEENMRTNTKRAAFVLGTLALTASMIAGTGVMSASADSSDLKPVTLTFWPCGDQPAAQEEVMKAFCDKYRDQLNIDSIQFNDSLSYKTLKNGRTIYGGGGIMPDVFVPVDTTENSKYYRDLMAKGIFNLYAVDYVDKHRSAIKSTYSTLTDFDKRFALTEGDLRQFIAMGEKDSVKYDEKQYRTSETLIKTVLKGLIARDVYADPGAYTMIINHRNHDVLEALRVINDDRLFNSLLQKGNPDYERLARQHREKKEKEKKK